MFFNNDRNEMNMPYGFPGDIDINITNQNANMNTLENHNMCNAPMAMPAPMSMQAPMSMPAPVGMPMSIQAPIVEPGQEKVIHKTFVHEVPHVCPMNTKVINHHVYKHTYQPRYTCCEENVVSQEQCGSCCNYR